MNLRFRPGPKLGTPENPEIIEPGQPLHSVQQPSRFAAIFGLVRILFFISIPALFLDMTCAWLWNVNDGAGGFFAGVLFFLLILPAFLTTLIAIISAGLILLMMFLSLTGKPVTWSIQTMGMPQFRREETRIRDVTDTHNS